MPVTSAEPLMLPGVASYSFIFMILRCLCFTITFLCLLHCCLMVTHWSPIVIRISTQHTCKVNDAYVQTDTLQILFQRLADPFFHKAPVIISEKLTS